MLFSCRDWKKYLFNQNINFSDINLSKFNCKKLLFLKNLQEVFLLINILTIPGKIKSCMRHTLNFKLI